MDDGRHEEVDRATRSAALCPLCGAPVAFHEFGSGSAVFFCRRCSWSLIEDPDGEVERESTPDPDDLSWPPTDIRKQSA